MYRSPHRPGDVNNLCIITEHNILYIIVYLPIHILLCRRLSRGWRRHPMTTLSPWRDNVDSLLPRFNFIDIRCRISGSIFTLFMLYFCLFRLFVHVFARSQSSLLHYIIYFNIIILYTLETVRARTLPPWGKLFSYRIADYLAVCVPSFRHYVLLAVRREFHTRNIVRIRYLWPLDLGSRDVNVNFSAMSVGQLL